MRTKKATGNGKTRSKARSVAQIWTQMTKPENERGRRDDGDVAHASERPEPVEEREEDRLEARADARRQGTEQRFDEAVRALGFRGEEGEDGEAGQRTGAGDDRRAAEQHEPACLVARHLRRPAERVEDEERNARDEVDETLQGDGGEARRDREARRLRERDRANDLSGPRRKERRGREAYRGRGVQVPVARPARLSQKKSPAPRPEKRRRDEAARRREEEPAHMCAADGSAHGREIERSEEQDEEKRGEPE